MRSGRQSLGGSVLRDSNRMGIRSASPSTRRRVSFGGVGLNGGSDIDNDMNGVNSSSSSIEPKKDRRAMLEEWKARNRLPTNPASAGIHSVDKENDSSVNVNATASINTNSSLPLPPPATANINVNVEGTTALERFRMRKKQREQRQMMHTLPLPPAIPGDRSVASTCASTVASNDDDSDRPTTAPGSGTSSICFDDTPSSSSSSYISSGRRSMSLRSGRRMTISGGARRNLHNISSTTTTGGGVSGRSRKSMTPARISQHMMNMNQAMNVSISTESTTIVDSTTSAAASSSSSLALTTSSLPITPGKQSLISSDRHEDGTGETSTTDIIPTTEATESSSAMTSIIEHDTNTSTSTITNQMEENGPGLRSRILLMEQRIHKLEQEKIALSMSKAPLEARLRQKEDQWMKDQTKYEQEIASLMNTNKIETDKLKRKENELEELQIENNRLVFEMRKQKTEAEVAAANNAVNESMSGEGMLYGYGGSVVVSCSGEDNSSDMMWGRQLQNDRDVTEYKEKLRTAEEEIKALRLEKVSIESEVNATNMELSSLLRDFDSLQEEYEVMQAQQNSNGDAEIQLEELSKEHTATLALLNATSGELASLRSESKFEMEQKEKEWNAEKEKMLFEMSVLKTRVNTRTREEEEGEEEDEAVLRARIEEKDRRIEQLEMQVLEGEQIRRAMHNKIQELRGNIRVFVRTRPFLPGDNGGTSSSLDLHPDGENMSIECKAKSHGFKFDKVFPPSSGQDAVFDEVSEFVQSALDGYHVCLFSYGQTGSGKTHTMQGSGSGAMRGIIPRAVEQILNQAKAMRKQKWKFTIMASFLEIYNEELKDLLVNMNGATVTQSSGVATRNQSQSNKLTIRRERNGKSYVAGLKKINIDTEDAEEGMQCLKNLMAAAARARSVASTQMNAVSSRSHSVFMLHLSGKNEDSGTAVEGALNLCDLAGSERLDRSGAGNDAKRLKETQAINKSLSCLGDVFTALSSGSSHVPFRNSKLTYLLQDCLSGDGKALMFVNLSPTLKSSHESLCSLRFAQRVNQVELGKATKNISYSRS